MVEPLKQIVVMKANEVQIGDYVNYRGQIIKVTSLYDKGGSNEVGWSDKESVWVNGRCIEPIPLTPEILEKNGFHEEWDEDIKLMVCDTITIEIGNNYKLFKDGKMYLRRVLAPLYYVHQLQHALRLCGIEKTIEL